MVKMVFTDDELNKSAQLSAWQDFLGSFIRLKRVWEFTRERGSVQNFQNFYWPWISSVQEKLEDLWWKGCEFGSSGLAHTSPPSS